MAMTMTTATKKKKSESFFSDTELMEKQVELIKNKYGLLPDTITKEEGYLYDAKRFNEAFRKKYGIEKGK